MQIVSIPRSLPLIPAALLMWASCVFGQLTGNGSINATLVNKNGIALVFDTNAGGAVLGAPGSSAATLNFGIVSAFGPLAAGVTRPSVGPATFTVQTFIDILVIEGGLSSSTYTLRANLAAVAPTGFTYKVDSTTLTTTSQSIQTNGAYNTDVPHNVGLVVSTAPPGAGGPAVGVPVTAILNFTATAN